MQMKMQSLFNLEQRQQQQQQLWILQMSYPLIRYFYYAMDQKNIEDIVLEF